ncbi:MAG: hypothetical protein IBX50_05020 [Marinospirillum sp.]|uniref:hypothetical protein n=1 Tax=Marinospirillum sp. TaxID=2183934 RepID=UPI0019FFEA11|nr:hypothetical protein [Marinospirillum sp.]MBE0506069.1 hypothetical protein [Marinospirillum sp.]
MSKQAADDVSKTLTEEEIAKQEQLQQAEAQERERALKEEAIKEHQAQSIRGNKSGRQAAAIKQVGQMHNKGLKYQKEPEKVWDKFTQGAGRVADFGSAAGKAIAIVGFSLLKMIGRLLGRVFVSMGGSLMGTKVASPDDQQAVSLSADAGSEPGKEPGQEPESKPEGAETTADTGMNLKQQVDTALSEFKLIEVNEQLGKFIGAYKDQIQSPEDMLRLMPSDEDYASLPQQLTEFVASHPEFSSVEQFLAGYLALDQGKDPAEAFQAYEKKPVTEMEAASTEGLQQDAEDPDTERQPEDDRINRSKGNVIDIDRFREAVNEASMDSPSAAMDAALSETIEDLDRINQDDGADSHPRSDLAKAQSELGDDEDGIKRSLKASQAEKFNAILDATGISELAESSDIIRMDESQLPPLPEVAAEPQVAPTIEAPEEPTQPMDPEAADRDLKALEGFEDSRQPDGSEPASDPGVDELERPRDRNGPDL